MWKGTAEQLREALIAPFADCDIEWRVSATNKDKTRGLAVPYVTNRAIQNRLDDTVGIDGWYNEFVPWKDGKAQLCGISIYFAEKDFWLTKWDGADDSDIESVKGGISDSMKRAAVQWGIGRYLYGIPQVWVRVKPAGKGYVIEDDERPTLDQTHRAWVDKCQGKVPDATPQQSMQRSGPAPQSQRQEAPQTRRRPDNLPPAIPAPQQTPQQFPPVQSVQQAAQQNPQAPVLNTPAGAPPAAAPPAPAPRQGAFTIPQGCYLVTGAVLKPTVNQGQFNTSLQLMDSAGQALQAFLKGTDQRITTGTMLTGASFSSRQQHGITFYTLDAYQIMDCGFEQAA